MRINSAFICAAFAACAACYPGRIDEVFAQVIPCCEYA
ncbi:hypothetical protein NCGM946K2_3787 [Mycobacterium tuberculosis]|nr:hypothetical protein NCGM946K2_3787 [Mycobacterium tuberculosis]